MKDTVSMAWSSFTPENRSLLATIKGGHRDKKMGGTLFGIRLRLLYLQELLHSKFSVPITSTCWFHAAPHDSLIIAIPAHFIQKRFLPTF